MLKRLLIAALAGFLGACVIIPRRPSPTVELPAPAPVMRYASLVRLDPKDIPAFEDDLDTASLRAAVTQSVGYYQNQPQNQLFVLGKDTYTARDMAASMLSLQTLLDHSLSPKDWITPVRDTFVVYQSIGTDPDRTVTFSSYYEPAIEARLIRDPVHRFPLYARPPDLIDVDLGVFDPAYQGAKIAGRREGKDLISYPTRADIDSAHILKDQGLEIAWAKDPMDVLDLQIEGSGWLDLGAGELRRIRYDGNNGRRYRSVGQHLITTGRIPAKQFNRHIFLQYMARHPQERQSLLNVNERYIFFRIDRSTASVYAYGNIDVPLTAGRSMATDPKLFPKGALGWISTAGVSRFMLNQDEGGAIQGPGRVDIFAGHGQDAAHFATHLWNKGKLYFLVQRTAPP